MHMRTVFALPATQGSCIEVVQSAEYGSRGLAGDTTLATYLRLPRHFELLYNFVVHPIRHTSGSRVRHYRAAVHPSGRCEKYPSALFKSTYARVGGEARPCAR